jgi:hypothetical protein
MRNFAAVVLRGQAIDGSDGILAETGVAYD